MEVHQTAVTGRSDSQQLLEKAERANLFLMPLGEVRGWWRYHHLFADLLRARCSFNCTLVPAWAGAQLPKSPPPMGTFEEWRHPLACVACCQAPA